MDMQDVEADFTLRSRYVGWEVPFIRALDGMALTGVDYVEVEFDIDYAGHFSIQHVGHANLIFDRETRELNKQTVIIRRVFATAYDLTDKIFDQEQVKILLDASSETNSKDTNKTEGNTKDCSFEVFKIYYRDPEAIKVCWYSPACKSYLSEPVDLFMGIKDEFGNPVPVFDFPYIELSYTKDEDSRLAKVKGRADLDKYDQEAASALLSGIVNGNMRASNVYACPDGTVPPDLAQPKQLSVQLSNGAIFDRPLKFFSTPYPPQSVSASFQMILTKSAQETSQVNYAVNNRADTEKTATEVAASTTEASKLSGVQVIFLSIFIREVYRRCFDIYQSRALAGLLTDLPAGVLEKLRRPDGRPRAFIVNSSGDTDVIAVEENINKRMKFWPVISKTPLAMAFLTDLIRLAFPQDAARYELILQQGEQKNALITKLAMLLREAVTDGQGNLLPAFQAIAPQLQQLEQETQAVMSNGQPQ
jgi:hypothetical protein